MKNNTFSISQITYFKDVDCIGVKFPYNEVFQQKLKSFGFYYEKEKKYYLAPSQPFTIYIVKSYCSEKTTRTPLFLELEKRFKNELKVYELKKDNVPHFKYENQSLLITPKEHQVLAYNFLVYNNGYAILNDEQGVGKSLEAIMYTSSRPGKTVILCPKNLVFNWECELKKHLGTRTEEYEIFSYDHMSEKTEKLIKKIEFKHLIIDEAHKLSNVSSKRFLAINRLSKERESLILLTGKDIESFPMDFYGMLKLLNKGYTQKTFIQNFFFYTFENKRQILGQCKIEKLKAYISSFVIRRYLKDICSKIDRKVIIQNVELGSSELMRFRSECRDKAFLLNGHDVVHLNQLLSIQKEKNCISLVKNLQSQQQKIKIVIASQYLECLESLNKHIPFSAIYDPQKSLEDVSVVLLDSSRYREGIDLSFSDTMIFLDQFADESKNVQTRKRIDRLSQESNTIRAYLLETPYLDKYLRNMPKSLNYEQSLKIIAKYLNKFSEKAA